MIITTMIGTVQSESTPVIDPNYPVPGSGAYLTGATGLVSVSYTPMGTPYNPGGNVASVDNAVGALRRAKYNGNWLPTYGSPPNTWDMNWTSSFPYVSWVNDSWVSFGTQGDPEGNTNFSMEWKGYMQAPKSGTFNTYLSCDDDAVFWIGTDALTPTNSNFQNWQSNVTPPSGAGTNGIQLIGGQWYPVRFWFSEFTGSCNMQFFLISDDEDKYSGGEIGWEYNSATGGYNP